MVGCKFFSYTYGKSWRFVTSRRFSSLCLWTNIECAYCMAIMLICLKAFLIVMAGSSSFVSKFFIDGMCVVALARATKTMSGATFHPLVMMLLTSGWYFVVLQSRFSTTNLYHTMYII